MFQFPSLRLAASLFAFSAVALTAVPAAAQTVHAVAPPSEASYAAVLRAINPALPLVKARAYARSIMADAWRTKLDARFIMSIVTVESRWRSNAVSRTGARGLGQLMPATAATLGDNAWNAAENLRGTSNYLKSLMNRFAGKPNATRLAIAGYNAGPHAVERFHGIPPYSETQHYVVRVLHVWKQLNARVGKAFAQPRTTPAERSAPALPDERQWLSGAPDAIPAAAAAAAVAGGALGSASAATVEPTDAAAETLPAASK